VGRDSSVGRATRHALDGPGIQLGGGEDFLHPSRLALDLLYNGYRVLFPWVNVLKRVVNHSPPFCAEVKTRLELYLYSRSRPS
jgi:hypothetical protein